MAQRDCWRSQLAVSSVTEINDRKPNSKYRIGNPSPNSQRSNAKLSFSLCALCIYANLSSFDHRSPQIQSLIVRNGRGVLQSRRRRSQAIQTVILREGSSRGAAQAAAGHGEVGRVRLPTELSDGIRRDIRPDHRRQPGHPELPAARARQVRPAGAHSAPNEQG